MTMPAAAACGYVLTEKGEAAAVGLHVDEEMVFHVEHLLHRPTSADQRDARGPVDDSFPASVRVETIEAQETTSESTPEQRRWNAARGPRRASGDDRLMETVPPTTDASSTARCPTCGHTSTAKVARKDEGVITADYRCSEGHIWTTRWPVVA